MMTMEITEGNKLIDIFYSGRELMPNGKLGRKRGQPKQYENWYDVFLVSELEYHSSWSALMLVVEKIESFGVVSNIEKMPHGEHRVSFFDWNGKLKNACPGGERHESKITATWLAVIQFIQWYNNEAKHKHEPI